MVANTIEMAIVRASGPITPLERAIVSIASSTPSLGIIPIPILRDDLRSKPAKYAPVPHPRILLIIAARVYKIAKKLACKI